MPSSKRADRMRNAAAEEALRSAMRFRHGAVITKGGKVLGRGHNHVRTGFSGPLTAHQAIVLPGQRPHNTTGALDAQGVASDGTDVNAEANARSGSASCQSCFSMHAEMHAITSALRGARPHASRTGTLLGVDDPCGLLDATSSNMQVGSRCSDVPLSTCSTPSARSAAELKAKCDRALVEGAKREQRIAFSTNAEWCLKPGYKAGAKEEPTPYAHCAAPVGGAGRGHLAAAAVA